MSAVLKSGVTLAVIAAVCAALVAITYSLTSERIAVNEKAWLEKSLEPALAGLTFEGSVSGSMLVVRTPHDLPGPDDVIIYRVYADDLPVAALFAVTARDGYAGAIRVLIGIEYDGTVTGIRILEHRETPGLGDKIVASRSDWVFQFDGRSLGDPRLEQWSIRRDGGEFDQLTGASVTPRAVIKVTKETLIYFAAHRDEIFSAPATEDRE
ncbi:MAG: electron transport complex subunit RsxG [Proteobacteria bacterium]|nr:electron transport complex subunit RsxG [Pseudomonadota bacterium]MCH7980765.1 electron transport complex subunit RsxG [Pseudomonadota bacterium]